MDIKIEGNTEEMVTLSSLPMGECFIHGDESYTVTYSGDENWVGCFNYHANQSTELLASQKVKRAKATLTCEVI